MSHLNIIRAWKDAEYRHSLSVAEQALLPEHPAGVIELTDADLDAVEGGVNGLYIHPTPPVSYYFCALPFRSAHLIADSALPR
jgi:mersacidin/lichenicidin family type 2 lantibiotic